MSSRSVKQADSDKLSTWHLQAEELLTRLARRERFFFLEKKDVARTDLDPSERVFREPQAWDFYFRRFSSYRNDRHYTLKNSDLLLISSSWLPRHTLCPRTLISTHPLLLKLFLLRCFFSLLPRPALIPENLMISKTKTPQSPITSRPPEHPHLHSSRCHSGSARARACVRVQARVLPTCLFFKTAIM